RPGLYLRILHTGPRAATGSERAVPGTDPRALRRLPGRGFHRRDGAAPAPAGAVGARRGRRHRAERPRALGLEGTAQGTAPDRPGAGPRRTAPRSGHGAADRGFLEHAARAVSALRAPAPAFAALRHRG